MIYIQNYNHVVDGCIISMLLHWMTRGKITIYHKIDSDNQKAITRDNVASY